MNNKKKVFWIIGIIAVLLGLFVWARAVKTPESDIVSTNGIHWHPTLTITVQGEKVPIPPNIGLTGNHNPIHTHDEDAAQGVIHLEFSGVVKKQDITLGKFFDSWGKDIRSFGSNMTMKVNGVLNTEYEHHVLQETDVIELFYE